VVEPGIADDVVGARARLVELMVEVGTPVDVVGARVRLADLMAELGTSDDVVGRVPVVDGGRAMEEAVEGGRAVEDVDEGGRVIVAARVVRGGRLDVMTLASCGGGVVPVAACLRRPNTPDSGLLLFGADAVDAALVWERSGPPEEEVALPLTGNRLGDMFRRGLSSLSPFPVGCRVDRDLERPVADEDMPIDLVSACGARVRSVGRGRSVSR
jgi:hypothetical protein